MAATRDLRCTAQPEQPATSRCGPLTGITLIDMAGIGRLRFAASLLANAGARVVRVEGRFLPSTSGPVQARHDPMTRGRQRIALDLRKPGGAEALLQLAVSADALVEDYRTGVMAFLGVGLEVCLARRPPLVYGRMTGWGQGGPLAQSAGDDINSKSRCPAPCMPSAGPTCRCRRWTCRGLRRRRAACLPCQQRLAACPAHRPRPGGGCGGERWRRLSDGPVLRTSRTRNVAEPACQQIAGRRRTAR